MNATERPIAFEKLALGRHLTVEYYDCDAHILSDVRGMEEIFLCAARESGATILESSFHAFAPQGVSGMVVISESHFAVHAWPEFDYAAVDIFTCGDRIDFQLAVEYLRNALKSRSMIVSHAMSRGVFGQNGEVRHEISSDEHPVGVLSWKKRYESADAWGMLAAVDLCDCPPEYLTSAKISQLLSALSAKLASPLIGTPHCEEFHHAEKGGGLRFTSILEDGTVSGRMSFARHNLYCDIFMNRFFDPREVAELLLGGVKGSFYRLQVSLRQ